ncbi:MAG: C40 family peptidase [Chitinophagales bacterium]|nr:C40 family peptidase [Chitinophagales bacterium]
MQYAICPVSIVPIRSGANHKSEMISQLLFGELVEILERKGRQWVRVRCSWDNFVGWVAGNQVSPITPSEYEDYQKQYAYSLELFQPLIGDQGYLPIVMGCRLPGFDGIRLKMAEHFYSFSGQAVFPNDIKTTPEFIIKLARKYLNAPFLWGGRSPMGIDAPGLVQMVYKLSGVKLPREVAQQVYLGDPVDFVEQAQAGDVAYFENRVGRVSHCGIILPEDQIIHVFGQTRIDSIDHFGIYDKKQGRYTHKLRVVKRMLKAGQKTTYFRKTETENEKEVGQYKLFL